jgi:probable F420-dependent oxidoreductase
VRVGLQLPLLTVPGRDAILTVARAAERLRFDSLWTNSHTVVPVSFGPNYPYSETGMPAWNATTPWPDAMTSLAFVAAATERIRLGVAVVPLITTDPLTLAKQAATIDVLSGGRFELGVGAGWLVEEAAALGRPTDHRSARMKETLEILALAWSRPTFEYAGRFFHIPAVGVNPKPVQPKLPVWVGGQGDAAIRLSVDRSAGLFIWFPTPQKLAGYREKLRALSPTTPLAASLNLTPIEPERWPAVTRPLRDAGADLLVVGRRWDDRYVDHLERFASEVLPSLTR